MNIKVKIQKKTLAMFSRQRHDHAMYCTNEKVLFPRP